MERVPLHSCNTVTCMQRVVKSWHRKTYHPHILTFPQKTQTGPTGAHQYYVCYIAADKRSPYSPLP